ncbi:MAG TPA: hypothetical protein HA354_04325 [Candidatus Poseidoniaceae archaeon]|nr:hypothetical protein [Euryarchaeota archaeon]DAC58079.1 MAG TPA: hypothetical protein D7I07_04290 [Candidatus Poseidoniales archaeon]HII37703.1 hypothetical protein [Candidatus Poseidoniaceae archaeon]|tara:strand:+ start:954 stop:1454 length:501 start_codon:yes stop_codon:yes gene_type:complete
MGAGGSADAMKFSDVLILVGIGMLCAGFIIHGWVESIPIASEDETPYEKSVNLMKGDELNILIACEEDCEGEAIITRNSEQVYQYGFQLLSGDETDDYFKSDGYDGYKLIITFDSGSGEVDVDVKRVLMLDFIIYPIGAAILIFGLQKRRFEMRSVSIDAELESFE